MNVVAAELSRISPTQPQRAHKSLVGIRDSYGGLIRTKLWAAGRVAMGTNPSIRTGRDPIRTVVNEMRDRFPSDASSDLIEGLQTGEYVDGTTRGITRALVLDFAERDLSRNLAEAAVEELPRVLVESEIDEETALIGLHVRRDRVVAENTVLSLDVSQTVASGYFGVIDSHLVPMQEAIHTLALATGVPVQVLTRIAQDFPFILKSHERLHDVPKGEMEDLILRAVEFAVKPYEDSNRFEQVARFYLEELTQILRSWEGISAVLGSDSTGTKRRVHRLVMNAIADDMLVRGGDIMTSANSLGAIQGFSSSDEIVSAANTDIGNAGKVARGILRSITPNSDRRITVDGSPHTLEGLAQRWSRYADMVKSSKTQDETGWGSASPEFIVWAMLFRGGVSVLQNEGRGSDVLDGLPADQLTYLIQIYNSLSAKESEYRGTSTAKFMEVGVADAVAEISDLDFPRAAEYLALRKNGVLAQTKAAVGRERTFWKGRLTSKPHEYLVVLATAATAAEKLMNFDRRDDEVMSGQTRLYLNTAFSMALDQAGFVPTPGTKETLESHQRYGSLVASGIAKELASRVPGGVATDFMDRVVKWFEGNPKKIGLALTDNMTDIVEALFQDGYSDRFTQIQREHMQQQLVTFLANIESRVFADPGNAVDQFAVKNEEIIGVFDNMFRLISLLPRGDNEAKQIGTIVLDGDMEDPITIKTRRIIGNSILSAPEAAIIFTAGLADVIASGVTASGRGFEMAATEETLTDEGDDDIERQIGNTVDASDKARLKRIQAQKSAARTSAGGDRIDLTSEFSDMTTIASKIRAIQAITSRYSRRIGYNCRIDGNPLLNNFGLEWLIPRSQQLRSFVQE